MPLRPSSPLWLAEHRQHLVERLAGAPHHHRQGEGIEVADAVVLGQAALALKPMLVATLRPSRIAHSELDPPRWQEMIRRPGPSSSAVRVAM